MRLDLGGGHAPTPGHINIDLVSEADMHWDLNNGLPLMGKKIDNPDTWDGKVVLGLVEGIRCHHVIEHLDSIIPLMNDCWDVMKEGALFEISTPMANTIQWYQDPTHKRAYVPESFLYFCKDSPYQKEQNEYGIKARFEIVQAEIGKGTDNWQLFVILRKPLE